jgi:hypothetical protein
MVDNHLGPFTEFGQTYIDAQPSYCWDCLKLKTGGHAGCHCDLYYEDEDDNDE